MDVVKKSILILLFIFFFYSLTKNFFEYQKNISFYESYKDSYEKEKKKNNTLKTQILKNADPRQVEKTIRNKLNLLKENEVAIILPEPTATPYIVTPTPAPVYKQWFDVFFKD